MAAVRSPVVFHEDLVVTNIDALALQPAFAAATCDSLKSVDLPTMGLLPVLLR